jgi:1-pyrroline-5-carboxylate dehydrogenase
MATANISSPDLAQTLKTPFVNEEFIDFTAEANKRAMQEALADVEAQLGREYDLVIGGRRLRTSGKIISTNPLWNGRSCCCGRRR